MFALELDNFVRYQSIHQISLRLRIQLDNLR